MRRSKLTRTIVSICSDQPGAVPGSSGRIRSQSSASCTAQLAQGRCPPSRTSSPSKQPQDLHGIPAARCELEEIRAVALVERSVAWPNRPQTDPRWENVATRRKARGQTVDGEGRRRRSACDGSSASYAHDPSCIGLSVMALDRPSRTIGAAPDVEPRRRNRARVCGHDQGRLIRRGNTYERTAMKFTAVLIRIPTSIARYRRSVKT
jgi:hypothetical protein